MRTPGGRIALLRHKAGLSQQALADKMHRSQAVITRWERNVRVPDDEALSQLAAALDCSVDFIVNVNVIGEAA